jgi:hypothetical protein
MSTSEPKASAGDSLKSAVPDSDVRFRYIGFGIYPKRIPRFWKSDAEAEAHAKKIKLGEGLSTEGRDFSLLHVVPVTKADRIVVSIVAIVLLATLVMPWVHFRTTSGSYVSLGWGGALGTLLGGLSNAFAGGIWVGISALLGLVLLIGTPILGIWILASMWTKAKSDEAFLMRLRRPLNLSYALFFAGLFAAILSLFGGHIPGYDSWGLINPGESYGVMTLVTILSYGAYAAMAMGLVAGVKSSDL